MSASTSVDSPAPRAGWRLDVVRASATASVSALDDDALDDDALDDDALDDDALDDDALDDDALDDDVVDLDSAEVAGIASARVSADVART
ncbi:MAG: hypothetical protein AB7L94_19700, partial [Kofleriaceae bacterium]